MNYKFGFIVMVIGVVVAGIAPFAMSQQQVEPSMEIDMLQGQTQYPFRIQDNNDQNVFYVDTNGKIFPSALKSYSMTPDIAWMGSLLPYVHTATPDLTITDTVESGAGVYQYSYVIQEGDIPTEDNRGIFTLSNCRLSVGASSENVGAGAITANYKVFLNDVEFYSASDASVASGNFASFRAHNPSLWFDVVNVDFLTVGDEIGLKIWTDTSGDLVLRSLVFWCAPQFTQQVHSLNFGIELASEPNTFDMWSHHDVEGVGTLTYAFNYCYSGGCGELLRFNHPNTPEGSIFYPSGFIESVFEDGNERLLRLSLGIRNNTDVITWTEHD